MLLCTAHTSMVGIRVGSAWGSLAPVRALFLPVNTLLLSKAGARVSHTVAGTVGRGWLLCLQPQRGDECCAALRRVLNVLLQRMSRLHSRRIRKHICVRT